MLTFFIALSLYLIIAVIVYGISFSFWQNTYPENAEKNYIEDSLFSIVVGLFWIIIITDGRARGDMIDSYKENGLKFY